MAIRWTDDLSVGVEEIDDQHKELIKRIDTLLEAMCGGEDKNLCDELIAFLESYVVEHFSAEEREMTRFKYSAYKLHKDEHEKFVKDFGKYKERYESGEKMDLLEIQLQNWLYNWLRDHIRGMDRQFGTFLKQKLETQADEDIV